MNKFNERAWAGQIIAWIHEAITNGTTIFQHASNDEGIKVASGRTKFPDVLLFIDKISGIVFNGWELKFPDTEADDSKMLINALEKAERLKSNSFVTWNGATAIIWQIKNNYSIESLHKLKIYPKEDGINTRNDLAVIANYRKHESKLKERLLEILHDLQQLYQDNKLKAAINISTEIILAIRETSMLLIPQIKKQIKELKGDNSEFRQKFNDWKIRESATLKILSNSSRRVENIEPEEVLAKFTYYKFIGKIIFYQTLVENLGGKIKKLELSTSANIKEQLAQFFSQAKKIDYQAVFEKDFTDLIQFNEAIDGIVFKLIDIFNGFDFKILPSSVISNILENLVPNGEKQKFGQYFTAETLAYFVAFPAIKNRNSMLFDPTSGTGTFLNVFYNILKFFGKTNHQELLSQIWGNDISHFPTVLSVINLYKQQISNTANFPRVTRNDFFNLCPGQVIPIPDNKDIRIINQIEIPLFDAIISNFPFIQQEDIPNDILTEHFRNDFQNSQNAFLKNTSFRINERSDYYIYFFYNSLKFLKPDGFFSAITSNAWLGKNYGLQFKQFILDNFTVRYIVKSNAEHWFKNSQVSTIFITLQRGKSDKPVKFITIDFKLEQFLNSLNTNENLQRIEDFYTQIDNCDMPNNVQWEQDNKYSNVFYNNKDKIRVSIVSRNCLIQSIETQENWATYFISENPLSIFSEKLINPQGTFFTNGRGTRTGQDDMFILSKDDLKILKIESDFLQPILRTSRHVTNIHHNRILNTFLFVCDMSVDVLRKKYPYAYKWVKKWETAKNKTGKLLPTVLVNRSPYWYTLKPEKPANIFISINPDKKLLFSYSKTPIYLNQRFVAIRANANNASLITALLNSVVSLIIVELNGVSRNLGALDLNANFFKKKIRIFNPALLNANQKANILNKFKPLSKRVIESFKIEFTKQDRLEFDQTVLKAFGFNQAYAINLYKLLIELIENRIDMKNR